MKHEHLWRIIDVEINRITEGLRVLEDLARFKWEDPQLSIKLKEMRNQIARSVNCFKTQLITARNAEHDLGLELSQTLQLDHKTILVELVTANFKRIQEGLRSLEEHFKILDYYEQAKKYEKLRFQTYTLEKNCFEKFFLPKDSLFPDTELYCLTASEYSLGRSNLEIVKAMLEAGVKLIQYREKDLKMQQQFAECLLIRELTHVHQATFIINDHLDLALAVDADGVHLGQDDLPITAARKLLGTKKLIGLSTHSPEQMHAAVQAEVDYIGVGPIYQTNTKKDVCAPVGLEYLDYVVTHCPIPFVAIGGIKEHNLETVIHHGAKCVALVTEIVGEPEISAKINNLKLKISKTKELTR